jgi:LuxR family glucitol operon transcriptional activator
LAEPQHTRERIPIPYRLGEICYQLEDYESAKEYYQQVVEHATEIGWQRAVNYAQNWLADIAIVQGALSEAEGLLKTGLTVAATNKDQRRTAFYKRSYAHLARARGDKAAMRRWAAEARDEFDRLGMQPEMQEMYDLEHAEGQ